MEEDAGHFSWLFLNEYICISYTNNKYIFLQKF